MSLLRELAGHPEYMALIKMAKDSRPEVPAWDSRTDNTDDWKKKSAMQEGFDLAMQHFIPK